MVKKSILFCLALGLFATAHAEEGSPNYAEMSIQELMNIKITVASAFASTQSDAPGIVTVFTAADIRASGASHITELIEQVPGFQVINDVSEVASIGFRGSFAGEGKILYMINSIPLNDLGYSGIQITDNIPLSMIEKIEIIRGPGSVVHGGLSELAVISIETKDYTSMRRLEASTAYGRFSSGGEARKQFTLGTGHQLGEKTGLSVFAYKSSYHRSDSTYTNSLNESADFSSHFDDNNSVGLRFQSGDFKINGFFNDYVIKGQQMGYDTPLAANGDTQFYTVGAQTEYRFKLNDVSNLKAYFVYRENAPFKNDDTTPGSTSYYHKKFNEVNPGLIYTYEPSSRNAFSLGTEYKLSHGQKKVFDDIYPFYKEGVALDSLDKRSYSVFGEAVLHREFGNLSFGLRHEKSDCCAAATVPRLVYTTNLNKWNFKALASVAYRTPGQENHNIRGEAIDPETAQTYELEANRELNSNSRFALNLFYLKLFDPIIYNYTPGLDGYDNGKDLATYGAELEYRYLTPLWNAKTGYSYSQPEKSIANSTYSTDDARRAVGLSNHKLSASAEYKVIGDTAVGSSAIYFSERRVFRDDGTNNPSYVGLNPYTLVAAWVTQQNLLTKGLSATLGANNLLNADNATAMAFYGSGSVLGDYPKRGTEFFARLGYKMDF